MEPATDPSSPTDRLLHESFAVSILMKGAMALLELVAGVLLLAFGARAVGLA